MAHLTPSLLSMLGLNATGDLGPLSIYKSQRHKLVFYPRVPALNPPSALQKVNRSKWRIAAMQWTGLPEATRQLWETASKRACLKVTGYNLWIYYATTLDRRTIQTIENQSGIDLLP